MNKMLTAASLLLFTAVGFAGEAYSSSVTVEKVLSTDTTSQGQKLKFPDSSAAVTGITVTIPVGGETGFHSHAYSGFAYIIEGDLTVETEKGSTHYGPGSSFAEVIGLEHNGKNSGTVPVKLIAFFTGKQGEPISQKRAVK